MNEITYDSESLIIYKGCKIAKSDKGMFCIGSVIIIIIITSEGLHERKETNDRRKRNSVDKLTVLFTVQIFNGRYFLKKYLEVLSCIF